MKWYLYDYFIRRPEPTRHFYWNVGGDDKSIPAYIKSLETEIGDEMARINPAALNSSPQNDYVGGMKVDRTTSRACVFRVYPGGTDDGGRPGRWILLVLEFDLFPLDALGALELECFSGYRVESGRHAQLPAHFPTLMREEPLHARIDLPESALVSEEQGRDFSFAMTSGRGTEGSLLVKRLDGKFHGTLRTKCIVVPPPLPETEAAQEKKPTLTESPGRQTRVARFRRLTAAIVRNPLARLLRAMKKSLNIILILALGFVGGLFSKDRIFDDGLPAPIRSLSLPTAEMPDLEMHLLSLADSKAERFVFLIDASIKDEYVVKPKAGDKGHLRIEVLRK